MRTSLIIFILATIGISSCGQIGKSTPDKVATNLETVDSTKNKRQKSPSFIPDSFIDTKFKYTDSAGKDVIIQNGFPRGGAEIDGIRGYYDSSGTHYGYGIFWTRVINETDNSLDLAINFPAYSIYDSHLPNNYLKLFLPTDTMTVDKLQLYNYGITGLKSFLNDNFNKPTMLEQTINPNEEYIFYTFMLVHAPDQKSSIRTGVVLEEQNLLYRISMEPIGDKLIPCGQFVFNN